MQLERGHRIYVNLPKILGIPFFKCTTTDIRCPVIGAQTYIV